MPHIYIQAESKPDFDGKIIIMRPYVIIPDLVTLPFNNDVTLEMDLCLKKASDPGVRVRTSVMAESGVYTHYICNGLPCTPDNNVIGAQTTPMPVANAEGTTGRNTPKIYVAIFNAGGDPNSDKPPKYIGQFRFGARFTFL